MATTTPTFEARPVRNHTREFCKRNRVWMTDGMPVDLDAYPGIRQVVEELRAAGYDIVIREGFLRKPDPGQGFFAIGCVAATKGDGDIIYRLDTPGFSDRAETLDGALDAIALSRPFLYYNGEPLAMGRGQYRAAKQLADRLLAEHPLAAQVFIPCWTNKGCGGRRGMTIAAKSFARDASEGAAERTE